MDQPTVLVTGGAGRVGMALVSLLLQRGYTIHSLDINPPASIHRGYKFFQGSVSSLDDLKLAAQGTEAIFHVASMIDLSPGGEIKIWDSNVQGTDNVIKVCKSLNISKLVYTSTLDVTWDWNGLSGPPSTTYPSSPANGYIKTKGLAEKMVLNANGTLTANGTELLTCALRPVHIYGPGDMLALSAVDLGKKGFVPCWPGGQCDFVYVKNVAFAHLLALDKLYSTPKKVAGNVYYIKDDYRTSYLQAIHDFSKRKNPKVKQVNVPYELVAFIGMLFTVFFTVAYFLGFNPEFVFSYFHVQLLTQNENVCDQKTKEDLGYQQLVSTRQALDETERWIDVLP